MPEHGTRNGYQWHIREGHKGKEICTPCREASNAAMKEYRSNSRTKSDHATDMRARRRALARLKQENEARYAELLSEEFILAIIEQLNSEE
jgi:hypothetical protein